MVDVGAGLSAGQHRLAACAVVKCHPVSLDYATIFNGLYFRRRGKTEVKPALEVIIDVGAVVTLPALHLLVIRPVAAKCTYLGAVGSSPFPDDRRDLLGLVTRVLASFAIFGVAALAAVAVTVAQVSLLPGRYGLSCSAVGSSWPHEHSNGTGAILHDSSIAAAKPLAARLRRHRRKLRGYMVDSTWSVALVGFIVFFES